MVLLLIITWCIVEQVLAFKYQLHFNVKATWLEAREMCHYKNRILARINTQSDQEVVESLKPYAHDFFWIGLKGGVKESPFLWTDSSMPTYSNWAEGFPGGIEGLDCIRIRYFDFKWETFNCSKRLNVLCENAYHRDYKVTDTTKMKGLMLGFGAFGILLILTCVLLNCPCCNLRVSNQMVRFGLGQDLQENRRKSHMKSAE